jgi:hypothetical protein
MPIGSDIALYESPLLASGQPVDPSWEALGTCVANEPECRKPIDKSPAIGSKDHSAVPGQLEAKEAANRFSNAPDGRIGIGHSEVDAVRAVEVAVAQVEPEQPGQVVGAGLGCYETGPEMLAPNDWFELMRLAVIRKLSNHGNVVAGDYRSDRQPRDSTGAAFLTQNEERMIGRGTDGSVIGQCELEDRLRIVRLRGRNQASPNLELGGE